MARPLGDVLLEVRSVSKTFTATRALDHVDVTIRSGEIVALCGQNGSGKSTLIKVLAGFHDADPGGSITVHGTAYDPKRDTSSSIHFIHQDLALVNTLSAVENLALSRTTQRPLLFPNQTRRETQNTAEVLDRLGVDFPLTVPIAQLTQAERTMVAIARAIDGWDRDDNILVLDEPTAALHEGETRLLFDAVRALAAKGAGVLFVSHRLDEVLEIADRTVVFRDGRVVAEMDRPSMTSTSIVAAVVGGRPAEVVGDAKKAGDVVLELSDVAGDRVRSASLTVRAGEIVGVSGLIGSGAETLGSIVAGASPRTAGAVSLRGAPLPVDDVSLAIKRGLAWAPADRQTRGAVMTQTVSENITLPKLGPVIGKLAQIRRRAERMDSTSWIERLQVKPHDPGAYMTQLSGGNQQKVVLAKWLRTDPALLWLDEPTQGVDVGAKAAIHQLIVDAAAAGKGVVVSSTDSAELVAICHRVIVFDSGRIVASLEREILTEQVLLTESIRHKAERSLSHRTEEGLGS